MEIRTFVRSTFLACSSFKIKMERDLERKKSSVYAGLSGVIPLLFHCSTFISTLIYRNIHIMIYRDIIVYTLYIILIQ